MEEFAQSTSSGAQFWKPIKFSWFATGTSLSPFSTSLGKSEACPLVNSPNRLGIGEPKRTVNRKKRHALKNQVILPFQNGHIPHFLEKAEELSPPSALQFPDFGHPKRSFKEKCGLTRTIWMFLLSDRETNIKHGVRTLSGESPRYFVLFLFCKARPGEGFLTPQFTTLKDKPRLNDTLCFFFLVVQGWQKKNEFPALPPDFKFFLRDSLWKVPLKPLLSLNAHLERENKDFLELNACEGKRRYLQTA